MLHFSILHHNLVNMEKDGNRETDRMQECLCCPLWNRFWAKFWNKKHVGF